LAADENLLAEEAEQVLKNTGEKNINGENLLAVEFYAGKVLKNGQWHKTGKTYWIYTLYQDGKRQRISPSRIYRREKGVTSIEKCPYDGRVSDYRWRIDGGKTTGGQRDDGRLQGVEDGITA